MQVLLSHDLTQLTLGELNDLLYEGARNVISTRENGDLASAVRELNRVVDEIDLRYLVDQSLGVD